MRAKPVLWTFIATSVAAFMVSLDNLVVTMALPSIRADLHAGLSQLEWTVNAYTLSFAVFLLTGAALGDRFGRRRMFAAGLSIFTVASAAAALAPNVELLVAARALQGIGAAIVLPLSMTLLSAAVPAERRGAALGVWGAVSGLGVAVGPVVGGAVVEGAAWQWIFWLNVPIGLIVIPIAMRGLRESLRSRAGGSTCPVSSSPASVSVGVVLGVVRGNDHGWTSLGVVAPIVLGAVLLAAFVAVEKRSAAPMLPLRLFANRSFTAVNVAGMLFSFGMFGAIFLLAQSLQIVQGYSPLAAGLRTLPWTAMPLLRRADRRAAGRPDRRPPADRHRPVPAGDRAAVAVVHPVDHAPPTPNSCPAFLVAGLGMSLFFVPVGTVVLGSVRPTSRASPPAPTTRSARSAASSGSPYSPRSSRPRAATPARRPSSTAPSRRCSSGRSWWASAPSSPC